MNEINTAIRVAKTFVPNNLIEFENNYSTLVC